MKDLTAKDTFASERVEFNRMLKRVIKTSEWNDKLEEIKEWEEEQERLKGRQIQDDLGSYQEYEQVKQISPEERRAAMNANRKTDYEMKVEEIRKTLGVKDENVSRMGGFGSGGYGSYGSNSGFGQAGNNRRNQSSLLSYFSNWFEAIKFGRELSVLEIENNKKLIEDDKPNNSPNRMGGMRRPMMGGGMGMNNNSIVKESKDRQNFRMKVEDWKGYLYQCQIGMFTFVLSSVFTIFNWKLLFIVPSYYLAIASLISVGISAFKLQQFEDGPLFKNFTCNEDNIKKAIKEFKEEQNNKKDENDDPSRNRPNVASPRRGPGVVRAGSNRPNLNIVSDDDDDDDDWDDKDWDDDDDEDWDEDDDDDEEDWDEDDEDDELEKSDNKKSFSNSNNQPQPINVMVTDKIIQDGQFKFEKHPNNPFEVPQTDINIQDKKELFEYEEEFLKYVARHRAEFAKLHSPSELLRLFAPLIPSFNKTFAGKSTVARDSWTFKNICYILGKTYAQIDSNFERAGEHDPNYFFCVDEIIETGLFYKIKIRLPRSMNKNTFKSKEEVFKSNLKLTEKDVVDINAELPNQDGYIKIFKITTNDEGQSFLPLVSSGDVLRFKGMKANGTKTGIIEALDKPADLSILFGLTNAEDALIFDIAGKENTAIAVNGFTGSGKTASTGSWLANMLITHSPDELGVILMDPKDGSFWANFKYAPHVLGYFGREDMDKYPAIIAILNKLVKDRQKQLNEKVRMKNYYEARKFFKSKGQWDKLKSVPRLIVVADEQLALLSGLDNLGESRKQKNKALPRDEKKFDAFWDTYNSQIGALANVVREGGITLMALSQRTDSKSFPRSLLAASSIKFLMKSQFEADAERLMGKGVNLPDVTSLPVGSGYLMANGINLSQLTTPLYSGNPGYLEEMVRIVSLAWVIIEDYKQDLNREPAGYFLSKASQESLETFKEHSIEPFNLFNRDRIFKEAKDILRKGDKYLHFDPEYPAQNFSIDLDKLRDNDNNIKTINANETDINELDQSNNNLIQQDNHNQTGVEQNQLQNVQSEQNQVRHQSTRVNQNQPQNVQINQFEQNKFDRNQLQSTNVQSQNIQSQNIQSEQNIQPDLSQSDQSQNVQNLNKIDNSLNQNNIYQEKEDNLDLNNFNSANLDQTNSNKESNINSVDNNIVNNNPDSIKENIVDKNNDDIFSNLIAGMANAKENNIEPTEENTSENLVKSPNMAISNSTNDIINNNLAKNELESDNNKVISERESEYKQDEQLEFANNSFDINNFNRNIPNQHELTNNNNIIRNDSSMINNEENISQQNKDDLTVSDIRQYFVNNSINEIEISKLLNEFNDNTIKAAIDQSVIYIDPKTNKVVLI